MFRRTLMILALCAFTFTAAASAQTVPPAYDFHFHKSVFQNREVIQTASKLFLPAPPANGWATAAELRAVQVDAALDWLVAHGYLFDTQPAVSLQTDANGNHSLVITGPGFHISVAIPGPFLPQQREQLLTATIIRNLPPQINNGF